MTVPNPPASDPWAAPAPPPSGTGAERGDQPPPASYEAPNYHAPGYPTPTYQAPGYQAPGYQTPGYQAASYQAATYPGSSDAAGSPTGGWGAAPSPGTNPWAIASLVSSLLCLVPVGLVTGIVALVQLRKRPQQGKGLAIAGIVISTVVTVVGLVGLALTVVVGREFAEGFESGDFDVHTEGTVAAVQGMDVGECFSYTPTGTVAPLDCAAFHDGELYLTGTLGLSDDSRSLDLALAEADDHCYSEFEQYVGTPYEESDYDYLLYAPDQASWDAGDRAFACALTSMDFEPLQGSARGSGN